MKKGLLTIVILSMAVGSAWAADGLVVGDPGLAGLSSGLNVTVTIPRRVGINVINDVAFDFGTIGGYPPVAFPADYAPSFPVASPNVGVEVFSNANANWVLAVKSAGGPYWGNGPTIGQLLWDDAPYVAGTAFTTSDVQVATGARTNWSARNQDYRLHLLGTEEEGSGTVVITYTITVP